MTSTSSLVDSTSPLSRLHESTSGLQGYAELAGIGGQPRRRALSPPLRAGCRRAGRRGRQCPATANSRTFGRDTLACAATSQLLWRPPPRPHVPITTDPRARATPSAGLLCACAPPRATLLHATPGTGGFGPRRKPEATPWGLSADVTQIKPDSPLRPSASSADGLFGTLSASAPWPFHRTLERLHPAGNLGDGVAAVIGARGVFVSGSTRHTNGFRTIDPEPVKVALPATWSKTAGSKRITLNASSRTWSGARRQKTCASPPGPG